MGNMQEEQEKQDIGSQIVQYVKNSNWWLGVFGNMLATMIGIGLTVGVGYLNTYLNDKRMAREMMFNILRTAEESIPTVETIDSLRKVEQHAASMLWSYYRLRDIIPMSDDSLDYYFQQATILYKYTFTKNTTDKYFFSAQMMHQFKNPKLYEQFGEYVQFDSQACDKYEKLHQDARALQNTYRSKIINNNHYETKIDIVKELIDNERLTEYISNLETSHTTSDVKQYKSYFKNLLKAMGATQEEYEEYMKTNKTMEEEEEE